MKGVEWGWKLDKLKPEYEDKEEGLIIARDHLNTDGKLSKRFTVVDRVQLEAIKQDYNLYEVICRKSGYCFKMYYDIDLYINPDDIDKYTIKINQFINILTEQYAEIFPDKSFGCDPKGLKSYNSEDIIILSASRMGNNGKYKLSNHIILPLYFENPVDIYTVFTYINSKIQFKIDCDLYDAIDKEVYIKSNTGSHQLRLLGQTKLGKPDSILKCKSKTYKLIDSLITQLNSDGKALIKSEDIKDIESNLKRMADKRGVMSKAWLELNKTDMNENIEYITYNYMDMLNMRLNIQTDKTKISNMDIYELYLKNGANYNTDVGLYLSVIPNTPDNKQSFRIWWIIGAICKKMNINYNIFESWTLQAYHADELAQVARKCKAKWDEMKDTKYGIIHIINIAKNYAPDIYLRRDFVKRFISHYRYDKSEWETVKKAKGEMMDIQKYYRKGYSGLVTDENVGGGKTNAVIQFAKENDDIFIILFSNRILFATEISARFTDELGAGKVINYDENRDKILPSLNGVKVLVISFESLTRWNDIINKRCKNTSVICVYDEFETLHRNLSSKTVTKPYETVKKLMNIWEKSKFNIIIDAYMTKNAYDFVNKANEITSKKTKMIYIDTDDRNDYPKTFNIRGVATYPKKREQMAQVYLNDIGDVLNEDPSNTIVIFCEVYNTIENICAHLENNLKIPREQILKNTGGAKKYMTAEEICENKSYFKNKEKMRTIRIWIYNSSILNAISIENVQFTKCYGIVTKYAKDELSSVGILGNDFLNAVARSRLNKEWEVYFDVKENTAFTYLKWKGEYEKEDNINDIIKTAITKELDEMRNKHRTDGFDVNTELEDTDIFSTVSKLNDCFSKPLIYKYVYSAGYGGTQNMNVRSRETGEVILTISRDKIDEWNGLGYLIGDANATEMLNIIIKNNNSSEILNGIYKIEVIECLAQIKGNITNWCDNLDEKRDENKIKMKPIINTKSVIVTSENRMNVIADDKICKIIEKYYNIYGDEMGEMLNVIKSNPAITRNVENWVAIIDKKQTSNFNPLYVLEMMNILGITRLDKLPDLIAVEDIDKNNYYEKGKDIITNYKKSLGLKITPDAVSRQVNIFMKYLNSILRDTGYKYMERKKRSAIYSYELDRVTLEIEINNDGGNLYTSKYFERIWEYGYTSKCKFINDE